MEIPVPPAGSEPAQALAPAIDSPADAPPPQPTLTALRGGGDTTDARATLHAVPRP